MLKLWHYTDRYSNHKPLNQVPRSNRTKLIANRTYLARAAIKTVLLRAKGLDQLRCALWRGFDRTRAAATATATHEYPLDKWDESKVAGCWWVG